MSKLEKYSSYKDSGVEWLGEIPEHWETLSNKNIFKIKQKLVGKKSSEYDLLSLTIKGIIKRDMENPQGKFPAEFNTYQEVKQGDFVFCLFDVGAIGNESETRHSVLFTLKYRNPVSRINFQERFTIHKGLWKAFNLV